jgi:hypothetical protein
MEKALRLDMIAWSDDEMQFVNLENDDLLGDDPVWIESYLASGEAAEILAYKAMKGGC